MQQNVSTLVLNLSNSIIAFFVVVVVVSVYEWACVRFIVSLVVVLV